MPPLLFKNFLYFSLGSISTLAIFYNKPISLLNILSLSSFLIFIYLNLKEENNIYFLSLEDLLTLILGLILEFTFLSNTFLNFINFKIINYISGTLMIIFFILIMITLLHYHSPFFKNLIRHPLYSFITFFIISSCVYAKCFCLLGFYALKMHNDLIKRVREEEQRMIKKNPEYVEYRREVWSGIIGMY
ncbi:hypothetical protein NBO_70g0011 [Nosema bombycis CQ1]|uniref:Uncharacterized protein n=1 Tax=Nosema bombycis (strain CQ1 / CVCC 102059) TaxID=578461 RepID=R0KTE9_NOSB1|nr:hypothetical protein NBO_70g0011 [Nosema bombycis CQ1]|eukprot:EOB13502.1 hypothetical protein NBO_70g0011 [Nosema bombycis CQ1]